MFMLSSTPRRAEKFRRVMRRAQKIEWTTAALSTI
jgi:hypothetical protein